MTVGSTYMLGIGEYLNTSKPFEQMKREIAVLANEAHKLDCNILLLGCLSGIANPEKLHQHLQALAEHYSVYIVLGLSGQEEKWDSSKCLVATPTKYGKSFCSFRNLVPELENYPYASCFDTPWGRVGVMVGESIVLQPEIQRYYAASGVILLLNPCMIHRKTYERGCRNYDQHRKNLAAIADRDQIYIASVNTLSTPTLSQPRVAGRDRTILSPTPDRGSYVSELLEHHDESMIATTKLKANMQSDSFTSDYFRPRLYAQWYRNLQENKPHMPGGNIKIAASNFDAEWGDKQANLAKIIQQSIQAAKQGCSLVLFPEMALTGYSFVESPDQKCMQQRLAETIPGPSTRELSKIAKEHQIYIVVGMPEKDQQKSDVYYNSAAVVCPDSKIYAYRKIHPVGDETRWCVSGEEPFMLDTPWGRIGISICFDTYSSPELTRYYAANGVRLLLNPTASMKGVAQGRWIWYYSNRLESIAYRDKMLITSANLLGRDGLLIHKGFQGGSSIHGYVAGHHKNYAGAFTYKKPGIIVSEPIDLSLYTDQNRQMMPDLYGELYWQLDR